MHAIHALSRLPRLTAPAVMTALADVMATLDSLDDRDALAALAEALPRRVGSLAPEVSVALSRIAARLVGHGAVTPDDIDDLADAPRVEWLRVRVMAGGALPAGADLRRVVSGWSVDAITAPSSCLRALAQAADPAVRFVCLEWLTGAVAGLGIGVGDAFELACGLTRDPVWAVRTRALTSAEFTVRFGLTLQQRSRREDALLAGLRASDGAVVSAALKTCAQLGRVDWLRDFVREETQPTYLRAQALAAMGPLAAPSDLPWALHAARVPGLEEACRACLLGAHRQGAFLGVDALDALLDQYDRNTAWTPDDLLRVTHLVRDALITRLATVPANDPRWIRRAALLAHSGAEAAPRVLERLLSEVTDLRTAKALISAARCSPGFSNADALLRWLDRLPDAAAFALRFQPQSDAQRAALADFVRIPHINPLTRATARGALAAQRTGPDRADPEDAAFDVVLPSNERSPERRLGALCARRDLTLMPQVSALFRTCVMRCVRQALSGDFSVKRVELPAVEQEVYRYGRGLIAAGHCLRPWSTEAPETGRDLLLALICDWLDEGPERAVMVALLEMAARHAPSGHWLRRIEGLWRHGDREVQRAAVDAILAAGEDAAGLALSLSRLVEAPSPRIAQRGLEAISTFQASWAEPAVIGALARPEMAVKRAAASALRIIASPAAVPAILDWLARHDNRGLRTGLKAAFATAAGEARSALLIAALDAESEPRRRRLLLDALDGLLSLAGLLRLVHRRQACADAIVDAVLDGRLRLADATRSEVAARLHRARVRDIAESDDPTADLRVRGFTPARARAVLAAWTAHQDPRCVGAVRARMAEWLAWCAEASAEEGDAAAALAVRSASRGHAEVLDALLGLAHRVPTSVALPFIKRCVIDPTPAQRQRAIDLLRTRPPSPEPGGYARFDRLQALEAVVTRADVWRCLQECAMGPDFAQRSRALLRQALQLSSANAPQALLDGAASWHQMVDAERAGWLDDALRARPLGVPPLPEPPQARARPPQSVADLIAALADPKTRAAAARALIEHPTAIAARPAVLADVLAGAFEAPDGLQGWLAEGLFDWPTDPDAQDIAMGWIERLDRAQLRTFIPGWLAARARGDARRGLPAGGGR